MLPNNKSLLLLLFLSLTQIYFVNSHEKHELNSHDHHLDAHDHRHDDHLHDHDHDHDHSHEHPAYKYSRAANEKIQNEEILKEDKIKPAIRSSKDVWFEAITSTLIISIIPYIVLIFIPINNPHDHHSLLKVLLSFASGGLLGDAFLHLIPHALMAQQPAHDSEGHHHHHHHHHGDSDSHDHGHVHDMSVGLWVLTGILVFLVIEKFVRIVKGSHHNHNHHHSKKLSDSESKSDESCSEDEKKTKKVEKNKKKNVVKDEIKVAGYLNLAADFAHNFTDGLAIGASYLAGNNIGYVTTLTILFHEVPHEIGDFAILIQSGCSKTKAMTLQLVTAFGALSGTVLSLAVEGMSSTTSSWILPFTAGGFIYIATVSVIPELLEGSNFKNSFFEIIALIVGVLSMVLIAQYE